MVFSLFLRWWVSRFIDLVWFRCVVWVYRVSVCVWFWVMSWLVVSRLVRLYRF